MTRAFLVLAPIVAAAAFAGLSGQATPMSPASDDLIQVVVELNAPSLAYASGPAAARRIDREQHRFVDVVREVPGASVHWRYRLVVNGVSVRLPSSELGRLPRLPGVKRVHGNATYHVLAGPDAATIRAREPAGTTLASAGEGVKIGIIDDGVDQQHPFFDPTGYTMPAGFPKGQVAYTTAKVIVARAFPPPGTTWRHARKPFDPEQSDHAMHVAGIAAGNANTLAEGSRVSGIAPRAYIGNYKVLTVPTDADVGLDGNAPELVAAIEAAVSDGMDVINLSLGEPEIEPSRDLVALALDAAATAGVVPVVSAGNDHNDFGEGSVGSPASAASAITVGAVTSTAPPAMTGFSSAGPTPISLRLKPDVVAPGSSVLSAAPEGDWRTSSGTSMAAPHVSGSVALLLQRHPAWTPSDVKAALTTTARPVNAGGVLVGPTRAGAGVIDVAAADEPFVAPSPTSVSFGLVGASSSVTARVAVGDAGSGAGTWAVSVELGAVPSGTTVTTAPEVVVPGEIALQLTTGATEGALWGSVVLRREGRVRRIPLWGRVAVPTLVVADATPLTRPGAYRGDTRGKPARVSIYRYPELPPGAPVSSRLAGPEQVFSVRITRPVANFGVVITSRGRNARVEPRVVMGGDENRLSGYAALPMNHNPYVDEFGGPSLAAGALRPAPGTYHVVFDSPDRTSAGAFAFRFWVDDAKPPTARLAQRTVTRGRPLRVRVADAGSGVDPRSIEATIGGRTVNARLRGPEIRVPTGGLPLGRHRLRVEVSDYQETRNNENVTRILPNTRVLAAQVTIRR